jgi:chemotaxis protein MotB
MMIGFGRFQAAGIMMMLVALAACTPAANLIGEAEARIREARSLDAAIHAREHFETAESAYAEAVRHRTSNNARAQEKAREALLAADRAIELARVGRDLARTRSELAETRDAARIEAERLRAEIAALTAERARLREEGERLTADRERLSREIEEQAGEIASAMERNRSLTAERDAMGGRVAALGAERDRLAGDLAASTEELKTLSARGAALEAELARLSEERTDLERRLAERVAALETVRGEMEGLRASVAAREREAAEAGAALERLRAEVAEREREATEAGAALERLRAEVASAAVENERLAALRLSADSELAALRRANEEDLAGLKARLAEIDEERRRHLEELQVVSDTLAVRDSELAALRSANERVMDDLKGLQSEQVKLREEAGQIILTFVDKILFESGKADLEERGKTALRAVAGVLIKHPERMIQIAGHTDTVPISSARFPSNWELSAARAVGVLRFLMEAEPALAARRFVASGYGEHKPVASNATPEGRAENRRVEIVILKAEL